MIGIFFFNIWWLLKEPFCWWFLKTSVVPLAIYPDSPSLVEGAHLVQALRFVVIPLAILGQQSLKISEFHFISLHHIVDKLFILPYHIIAVVITNFVTAFKTDTTLFSLLSSPIDLTPRNWDQMLTNTFHQELHNEFSVAFLCI